MRYRELKRVERERERERERVQGRYTNNSKRDLSSKVFCFLKLLREVV